MASNSVKAVGVTRPFPGMRPYMPAEELLFQGREQESAQVCELWRSRTLTVLHGPAGIGKSSLLHGSVTPRLHRSGAHVLPVGRVSGGPVIPEAAQPSANSLVRALLASWAPQASLPPADIGQFLRRIQRAPRPVLISIDQVEDMYASSRDGERRDLLHALLGPVEHVHLLLCVRDDRLEVLLSEIGDYFQDIGRFALGGLSPGSAVQAIRCPVQASGRAIEPAMAKAVVEELTTVRTIDHSGRVRTIEHLPTVDPWQLQAVCWRMWHMWPAGERNLSPGPHVGVNDALQEQLWSLANEVAAAFDHDPARLCSWLAATFISPAGSAHQVTEDLAESAGVPSGLLQALATRSLLRRCPAPREYAYTIRSTRLLEPLRQLAQRSASLTHLRLRPDDWLRAAADALADGDQDRGVRHLNYVVDSTVHDMRLQVQARTMLGNMGFARGDLVMARESYQQALVLLETQQDRDAVGVMLTAIGHICLAQGDIIAAQGLFRAAAGRLPSAPSIKVELAKALARGGHPSAAVAILRTVMSVSEDQEAQVLHGRIVSEMRGSLS